MALRYRYGSVVNYSHTAAVEAYESIVVGSMLMIPQADAAANEETSYIIPGVTAVLDNATARATVALGAIVYRIGSGSNAGDFNTTTTNVKSGYALSAASSGGTFRLAFTGPN